MKLRKLVSLGLLSTLAATMVVPAFATTAPTDVTGDETEYEGEALSTTITTTVNIPTISVIIPTTGAVVLNPYKLSVTPTGAASAVTDQIIAPVQVMQNKSTAPITVTLVPTATVPSGVTLVTEAPTATGDVAKDLENGKQIWLQVVANSCIDSIAAKTGPALADAGSPKKITMLATAEEFDMETIPTIDLDIAGTNTDTDTKTEKEFLAFQVQGEMSQVDDWTVDDVVEASIAWTFKIKPTLVT